MAIPPRIDPIPDPPLPTDSETVFDIKAGASLTAQQAMVPQINAAIAFINKTAVDASDAIEASATAVDAKKSAVASANNAAASAAVAEASPGSIGNLALFQAITLSF